MLLLEKTFLRNNKGSPIVFLMNKRKMNMYLVCSRKAYMKGLVLGWGGCMLGE